MRCGCGQTRHYEWCQSSTDDVYILRRSCLEAASLSPATAVPGPAVILLLNSLRWLTLTPPTTQPRQMIIILSSPVTMCIGWQYLVIFNLGVIIISACTKYTLIGTVHFTPRSVSLSPMMTWPMICRYLVFLSPCTPALATCQPQCEWPETIPPSPSIIHMSDEELGCPRNFRRGNFAHLPKFQGSLQKH